MAAPTILVADDDGAIRTVVSQALGRAGFEVRATGNAATLEALRPASLSGPITSASRGTSGTVWSDRVWLTGCFPWPGPGKDQPFSTPWRPM